MLNISKCQILKIGISKFAIFQITRPGFHFGVPKKRKVATKLISYERYGEILFQKVASGYLLHCVQDGPSKKAHYKISFSASNIKHQNFGFCFLVFSPSLLSP